MNLIGENLTYKPDNQFHLNNVSFDFKKGNLYTILGRTLSGKTTFLKTIAGLLNPDSGNLSFEGKDFSKIPVWERNVAMVYQQFINYPHLNVYENVIFPLKQRKLNEDNTYFYYRRIRINLLFTSDLRDSINIIFQQSNITTLF